MERSHAVLIEVNSEFGLRPGPFKKKTKQWGFLYSVTLYLATFKQ